MRTHYDFMQFHTKIVNKVQCQVGKNIFGHLTFDLGENYFTSNPTGPKFFITLCIIRYTYFD